MKMSTLTIKNPQYSQALAKIYDPPELLYFQGELPSPDALCFAVVGSRLPSQYGRVVVDKIVKQLVAHGLIIVSGLARGIDSLAHKAALEANGTTLAILGSGIDEQSIYPAEHRSLADQIIKKGGAVISEYPPGTRGLQGHFPARNRIISGMSAGVLVIEAKQKSGSLITAKFALDEAREVFAVPGPITSDRSSGTNWLIKQGAHPVTDVNDILGVFDIEEKNKPEQILKCNKEEKALLGLLKGDPKHIDDLVEESKLDITRVSSTLAVMELHGLVKNLGGMTFVKNF